MTTSQILRRLRLFLLVLSLMLFAGTLVELFLVKHYQDAVQLIALAIAALGLIATLIVLFRRQAKTVLLLRLCMLLAIAGSGLGVYEHVSNNAALEREIHPNSSRRQLVMKALGGTNPLLAPGTLAVAGLLALAATYKYSTD